MDFVVIEKILPLLDRFTILAIPCLSKDTLRICRNIGYDVFKVLIKRDCYFLDLECCKSDILQEFRKIYKRKFPNFLSIYQQKYTTYKDVIAFLPEPVALLNDKSIFNLVDNCYAISNCFNENSTNLVKCIKFQKFDNYIFKLLSNGQIVIDLENKRFRYNNVIKVVKNCKIVNIENSLIVDFKVSTNLTLFLLDSCNREHKYLVEIDHYKNEIIAKLIPGINYFFINYSVTIDGTLMIGDMLISPDKYMKGKTWICNKSNKFVSAYKNEEGIYGVLSNGKLLHYKNPITHGYEINLPSGKIIMPTLTYF